MFLLAMSSLCMALASVVTRAAFVNLLVFILFVLVTFMTLFLCFGRTYESLFATDTAPWLKAILYIMPWTHFGKVGARGLVGEATSRLAPLHCMHSPGLQAPTAPQVFVDIIQVTGFVGSPFASEFYTLSMLTTAGFVADPHSDPPPGSTRTISTGDSLGYQLLLVVVYYILTWCVACDCVCEPALELCSVAEAMHRLLEHTDHPSRPHHRRRYLGQVFAGDLGASQPFYFPFTQAYVDSTRSRYRRFARTAHTTSLTRLPRLLGTASRSRRCRYWTGRGPAVNIVPGDVLAEVRAKSGQRDSIELHKLSKAYSSKTAVKEVSLSIMPGQLLALLGQNGAGTHTDAPYR